MKKLLMFVLPLFLLIGCSSYISRYFYDFKYSGHSDKVLAQSDSTFGRYNHYFEDNFIKLYLDCSPNEIGIYLINKTEIPIKIIWDSVKVYSDYLKKDQIVINHSNKSQENITKPDPSSKLYNEIKNLIELKKEDSDYKIEPSIILANGTWLDEILFNKNVNLLPFESSKKNALSEKSNQTIGEQIRLILAIKINGETKEYPFVFKVKDFQILTNG